MLLLILQSLQQLLDCRWLVASRLPRSDQFEGDFGGGGKHDKALYDTSENGRAQREKFTSFLRGILTSDISRDMLLALERLTKYSKNITSQTQSFSHVVMPETTDHIDAPEPHELNECKTPRQFLEHPKVVQFLRIYNEKRRREWNSDSGNFVELTMDDIKGSKDLTNQLANFAVKEDASVRVSIHSADYVRCKIRSVQHALNRIQWGHADDSLLDQKIVGQ